MPVRDRTAGTMSRLWGGIGRFSDRYGHTSRSGDEGLTVSRLGKEKAAPWFGSGRSFNAIAKEQLPSGEGRLFNWPGLLELNLE